MSDEPPQVEDVSQLVRIRREKLARLRELGVDPFGGKYEITHQPGLLRARFEEGLRVTVAGRITALRDMGNSQFLNLADLDGHIQVFLNKKVLGPEQWAIYKCLDIGDWVGVEGETFFTKTGEPSVKAAAITALQEPPPAARQMARRCRSTDQIPPALPRPDRQRAQPRRLSEAQRHGRRDAALLGRIADSSKSKPRCCRTCPAVPRREPFETHHNALGMDLYLRIAPELYLKRLLVGGFHKVFELNRNFRNEGISRRHNPEFTMLEAYWAFADFEQMAEPGGGHDLPSGGKILRRPP